MAPNLRQADLEELTASTDLPPLEALLYSIETTPETWACVDDDGQPFALYGTGREEDHGAPWMLGTDGIERHWRWFLRNTPRIIEDVSRGYPLLFNAVDARNTVHVRWLEWAGFTVLPDTFPGPKGHPFHPFFMRSNPCAS
jgi:hypothetical protein